MTPAKSAPIDAAAVASAGAPACDDASQESGRGPRPSGLRIAAVVTAIVATHAMLVAWASTTRAAPASGGRVLATLCAAMTSAVLIGSAGEWLVHRFIMHRRWKPRLLRIIYDLHHVGHHFIHFTPERYVHEGPINYIPVWPPRPDALCRSASSRWLSMSGQFLFYGAVAVPLAVLPTVLSARNVLFNLAFAVILAVETFLFVRLHDSVHYPGESWLERLPLFARLDRHHYIHHIDTLANTNFLLPLGDLLFGTLRMSLTAREKARFPTYEAARRRIVADVAPVRGQAQADLARVVIARTPVIQSGVTSRTRPRTWRSS